MPLLSTQNLLRFREADRKPRSLARFRFHWKFCLPIFWLLALWGTLELLPAPQQTAETAIVVIPESMYLTIPQTIGLVPTQVDPAPLLSSLMATETMRRRIHQTYQSLCKVRKISALTPADYRLSFLPQQDQVTLALQVEGPEAMAVELLADVAAKTTLAVYQERMDRFVPQLRQELRAVLHQTQGALQTTRSRLAQQPVPKPKHSAVYRPRQKQTRSGFVEVSFHPNQAHASSSSIQILKDQLERIEHRPVPPVDRYALLRDQEWQEARIATLEHQLEELDLFQLTHKPLARVKSAVRLKENLSWDRVWLLSCLILILTGTIPVLLRREKPLNASSTEPQREVPPSASEGWDVPPHKEVGAVSEETLPMTPLEETPSVFQEDILETHPLEEPPVVTLPPVEEASAPEPTPLIHHLAVALPEPAEFLQRMQAERSLMNAFHQLLAELEIPRAVKVIAISQEARLAAGLAMAMAKPETSVCLVDCNVHEASLHTLFGIENDWGLAELLQAPAQAPQILKEALAQNPLAIFPAGLFYEVKLSDFEEFPSLIASIAAEVSYVVLNLPSLYEAEEVERLLSLSKADGLLVCGEAFESPELITALSQQLPIPWIRLVQWGDGSSASAEADEVL